MLQDEEPYIFRWLRKEYGGISKPTFSYRLISDMFFYPIYQLSVKIVDILLLEGMMFDTLFLFKIYRNKKRKMD